jgi:5-oxopent-3-ene-1,2,5-tricarboxylate decarboxylase / 2-hydroxyhepta-2,4-diene-1,7-dioate isomerase
MKIGYFSKRGHRFIGVVVGERVLNLTAMSWHGQHPFLQDITTLLKSENFRPDLFQALYDHDKSDPNLWYALSDVVFLPLVQPGKIICLGLNYAEHARESGRSRPENPIYFEKAVSAIISQGEPILYPANLGRIDPEVELAVIIGRETKRVDAGRASEHIAGYTILNDVTARDMQARDMERREPWYRSKSIDTFCPIGPWIVTADEIKPTDPLTIRLRVNGKIRQDGSTSEMIFRIPELIERISSMITLYAGDIISTGTPSGIAPIYPGDIVEAEIEKIGILANPVAATDPA